MATEKNEPSLRPEPTRTESRLGDLFARVESLLISVVAFFLIAFVIIALLAVVKEVRGPLLDYDFGAAAIKGTDATFLAIILLELLHTTLSRGPISQQLQEFLVIGVTATVRHGLDIAASRDSGARDSVINLAINAAGALVLVLALWLVRHQVRADERAARGVEPPTDAGSEGAEDASQIPY